VRLCPKRMKSLITSIRTGEKHERDGEKVTVGIKKRGEKLFSDINHPYIVESCGGVRGRIMKKRLFPGVKKKGL